jgi:hypothetical protein
VKIHTQATERVFVSIVFDGTHDPEGYERTTHGDGRGKWHTYAISPGADYSTRLRLVDNVRAMLEIAYEENNHVHSETVGASPA